ncbi:hypothetical protein CDAR_258981 [Caerostris darwini]|uniref:ATPase AAA-type core domain-containing protein n=1 Tax=Caerostris darwini TaxID=1538125 RepID=A0AAV4PSF1_9ARAC|nr:hypothetical protein CDAR_258981 [Caerostris darwini]
MRSSVFACLVKVALQLKVVVSNCSATTVRFFVTNWINIAGRMPRGESYFSNTFSSLPCKAQTIGSIFLDEMDRIRDNEGISGYALKFFFTQGKLMKRFSSKFNVLFIQKLLVFPEAF